MFGEGGENEENLLAAMHARVCGIFMMDGTRIPSITIMTLGPIRFATAGIVHLQGILMSKARLWP